jgi:chromosome segregation ATPase
MATRTVLNAFSATGGFLADCRIEFAPGLTCIIGARGTCKSTLVESIRFAFDSNAERVKELIGEGEPRGLSTFNLVKATLGAGSVRCETTNGTEGAQSSLIIEREVGGNPRVFLDGVREHASRDALHQIEIFSQGDLQRIAEDRNEDLRIALIDRPNAVAVERLRADRERAEAILRKLGPELRLVRAQISTLKQELQPLSSLRERLRQARADSPALSPELEAERLLYERRRQVVEALRELDTAKAASLTHLEGAIREADRMRACLSRIRGADAAELGLVEEELKAVEASLNGLDAARAELRDVPITDAIDALSKDLEQRNAPFYRMRQEQQVVNESLKQQQHLGRQVETLERRQKELETALASEANLLRDRQQARTTASRIDDDLFSLRIKEVDDINRAHGDTVAVTLKTGASSPRYGARLSELLTGSRVRGQEEVAAALADTFSPSALIDVVEGGNGQVFADALGRDIGQMNRVVAHLAEHADLYALEAEPPAARLEITLFDNGQPKPVETLSKGQKATALLPLIAPASPIPFGCRPARRRPRQQLHIQLAH